MLIWLRFKNLVTFFASVIEARLRLCVEKMLSLGVRQLGQKVPNWLKLADFFDFFNFLNNYLCDLNKPLHSFSTSEEGPVCVFSGTIQSWESGNLVKNVQNRSKIVEKKWFFGIFQFSQKLHVRSQNTSAQLFNFWRGPCVCIFGNSWILWVRQLS